MKLFEFEGKEIFAKYEIALLERQVLASLADTITLSLPVIVKAQVRATDRKKAGGILVARTESELSNALTQLFGKEIQGEKVEKVLIEQLADVAAEYYISFSYDTKRRGPVLAVSPKGGSGIHEAHVYGIDVLVGLDETQIKRELKTAAFPDADIADVADIVLKLWKLFNDEKATVAEINPILKTKDGKLFAGDAKVDMGKRRTIEQMGGDIAVIASGGGASLINMDALLLAGGKPANYTEYSGNPPKEVVTELTKQVFSQPGIKACWVIGGTANFTDIFETMSGFVEGLRQVSPKPIFPFVIRRGGPRADEAAKMLQEFAKKEDFEFYIYGSETPMIATAQYVVDLAYRGVKPPVN
ncbi:MAG: ATP citrate lyase citrate-binding domain-containing protein [bacterium]|nr:ATP citrate lyase citrate-binding domain-containing protein [bacterium]